MTQTQAMAVVTKLRSVPANFAAELLDVAPGTLSGWRRRGKIKATQDQNTGRWRFDVFEFLMRDDKGA